MNTTESVLETSTENTRRLRLTRMLDAIKFWHDRYGRHKFDPAFVLAMDLKHKNGTRLSDNQFAAIERIYSKWVKV